MGNSRVSDPKFLAKSGPFRAECKKMRKLRMQRPYSEASLKTQPLLAVFETFLQKVRFLHISHFLQKSAQTLQAKAKF